MVDQLYTELQVADSKSRREPALRRTPDVTDVKRHKDTALTLNPASAAVMLGQKKLASLSLRRNASEGSFTYMLLVFKLGRRVRTTAD
jgi:hypothetical protein